MTKFTPTHTQLVPSTPLHHRGPGSSLLPSIHQVTYITVQAAQMIYSTLFFGLPVVYATRAARYAATPAHRIAFISQLLVEWKIIIFSTTFLLSSVVPS